MQRCQGCRVFHPVFELIAETICRASLESERFHQSSKVSANSTSLRRDLSPGSRAEVEPDGARVKSRDEARENFCPGHLSLAGMEIAAR